MNYKLITAPATEPLTLTEVKVHLRVTGSSEDDYITALIVVARNTVEAQTYRPLVTQTWRLDLDYSELTLAVINLNKAPLQTLSFVKYYNSDNTLTTLDTTEYDYSVDGNPARVKLITVPTCYDKFGTLQIQFVCGYGAAAAVPTALKQAMLIIIGNMYENRQDVITGSTASELPKASQYLMEPYRNIFLQVAS